VSESGRGMIGRPPGGQGCRKQAPSRSLLPLPVLLSVETKPDSDSERPKRVDTAAVEFKSGLPDLTLTFKFGPACRLVQTPVAAVSRVPPRRLRRTLHGLPLRMHRQPKGYSWEPIGAGFRPLSGTDRGSC
jgi:hypothetical protein